VDYWSYHTLGIALGIFALVLNEYVLFDLGYT